MIDPLKEGAWLQPKDAGPLLGMTAREVQHRCADGDIDHQKRESPGGRVRYLISEAALRRYLNRNVRRAE